jgi:hypothetical protein
VSYFRPDDCRNACNNVVLQFEQVIHPAIVSLRPDMAHRLRLDQLRIDAHPVAGPTHAAFEDVPYAQLASDLPDVDRLALVGEG